MGNEEFRKVFDMYVDAALRVAVGIVRDPYEAQDVVQEVFIRLHRALPRLRSREALRVYIYRATVHAALNALRRKRREDLEPLCEGEDGLAVSSDDPRRVVEAEEAYCAILRLLGHLPARQRAAFVLREVEGWGWGT